MRRSLSAFALLLLALAVSGQQAPPDPADRANLLISLEVLGDAAAGVVARIRFRFNVPGDVPPGVPLVVQGSFLREGKVIRNFRIPLPPEERESATTVQTLPEGEVTVEARLMIPLEEQAPVMVGKTATAFTLGRTGSPYVAGEGGGAEEVFAEGVVPEAAGSVRIRPPRRDVAPNLFIVDVDVKPPVRRVEFWVEGKRILARSAPPWRAELDLGRLPKRVEVRVVGYDAQGRYVDADAFLVNERQTQLEVKITRTATPDGMTHFRLSVQNPTLTDVRNVALYAGQSKLHEWKAPPYALSVPTARLEGIEYVRASVIDSSGYEAADLLFLAGDRYVEQIEVHLIELPVSVNDASGVPVSGLEQGSFTVLENGKPQKISSFHFASNLPISVGVLLDHSGSMQRRIKDAKAAAVGFFRSIMKANDRAFFGAFAFDSRGLAPFVTEPSLVEAQVNASPDAAGGTALYDAIVTGLYRFRGIEGRKALIIITDGEDTSSRLTYDDMLTYARAARVPLYFIGVGLGLGDIGGASKMRALAAETGGVAYFIRDAKALGQAYAQLEGELRSQYLISYHTESTRDDQKYRTVEVKVDRPDVKARTIRGFIP
ncbi:MAG TPA: VWA domain-containing protein [Thermoanaerobaculia bacterium]|nr:VWA domain-containing protein [Thermoanaerobaculia bacterium]